MLCFVSSQQNCALLAEEAASLGMHCDGNEGNWGAGGGGWWILRAQLERVVGVVEQMGLRTAWPAVPRSSSAVPALRAAGAGGGTCGVCVLPLPGIVGFHRQFLAICWIVFHIACVSLGSCAALRWQGYRDWRSAALRICPYFDLPAQPSLCINPFNIFNSSFLLYVSLVWQLIVRAAGCL